jgi:hypothetical protein
MCQLLQYFKHGRHFVFFLFNRIEIGRKLLSQRFGISVHQRSKLVTRILTVRELGRIVAKILSIDGRIDKHGNHAQGKQSSLRTKREQHGDCVGLATFQ